MSPPIPYPIRILSDLHWGQEGSAVGSLSALERLMDGAGTVVFNGDSVETLRGKSRSPSAGHERLAELAEFVRTRCKRAIFLTGNHDPDISEHHHLDLLDGAVLVTHGDVLFDDILPWSPDGRKIRLEKQRLRALHTRNGTDPLVHELMLNRLACSRLEASGTHAGAPWQRRLHYLLRQGWPPWQPWVIWRMWRQVPAAGLGLRDRYRTTAGLVVVGHTHRAGIWTCGNCQVINTGSFSLPFNPLAVDLNPNGASARRIRRRANSFALEPPHEHFALEPAEAQIRIA